MNFLAEFEQACADNDSTKELLSSLPKTTDLLKILIRMKQYDRLPLLAPMVGKDNYSTVAKLAVNAIIDKQPQLLIELFSTRQLKEIVPFMCFYLGKCGQRIELLPKELCKYADTEMHTEGLIKGDYVDLLDILPHEYKLLGIYCSKNCMDKCGYSSDKVEEYFYGAVAFGKKNSDTIEFLKTKCSNLPVIVTSLIKEMYSNYRNPLLEPSLLEKLEFVVKQDIILEKELIDWLLQYYPNVYSMLQEQV